MKSRLAELLHLERPLVIFDYETTGVDTDACRAVSLAMKVHRPDGSLHLYRTLINPECPIPPATTEVHKITDAHIRLGCARCWAPDDAHPTEKCDRFRPVPRFRDIAAALIRGFSDADFGGYNVFFDLKVSAAEFRRCGIEFDYSKAYILDPFHIWRLLEPRHLTDAVEHFGKDTPLMLGEQEVAASHFKHHAHDAMADVEGTEVALIGQLTNHPRSSSLPRTVRELHERCFPRDPNALDSESKFIFINDVLCFNFGKHKNKPVTAEVGYIEWMMKPGQTFTPEVKAICARIVAGDVPTRKEETNA